MALPGVQVLFAFLLTVPFSQRFTDITRLQRNTFFATFVCTAVATVLLIAPTSYHRLRWRRYDKERMLITANHLTIAGLSFLALAIGGALFLISDVLFGVAAAGLAAGLLAALLVWFWFGVPILRGLRTRGRTGPG